jgi:predicted transcriptional regulator
MRAAISQLNLSARAYHRILKLARTIADLAGCEEIQSVHLAEALHALRSTEIDDWLRVKLERPWVTSRRDQGPTPSTVQIHSRLYVVTFWQCTA